MATLELHYGVAMILVFTTDGNCIEVESAAGADRRLDLFVCFDEEGREVASFPFLKCDSNALLMISMTTLR